MAVFQAPGIYIDEVPAAAPIVGVGTSIPAFIGVFADPPPGGPPVAAAGDIVGVTSITAFKTALGDFTTGTPANGLSILGHAVRGFFENGGTFCYVSRVATEAEIDTVVLLKLEAYDDVAMVAAPGIATAPVITALVGHCTKMADRIAILDAPSNVLDPAKDLKPLLTGTGLFANATDCAAVYTPWLIVFDDATKTEKSVPPSGHIAGIYARVDATRGVHKAPANEQVLGVIRPVARIGKAQQAQVNLLGGNCIRMLNGALKVWGARTLAGDSSLHKYIPIRRLLFFLYKSIDQGTQWAVFEPNGPDLWARIIRNVSSFLTNVWSQGALAGTVPEQAFYVKCDAENNPPDQRANGVLVVEVGVATVFPAEFVSFRIQQFTGPIK